MGRQSHKAIERFLKIGSMTKDEAVKFMDSEKRLDPRVEHWKRSYDDAMNLVESLMNALCEIRDKADPYTHQIHWCRETASTAINNANAVMSGKVANTPNDQAHRQPPAGTVERKGGS